jgi:hypothetical protein
LLKKEEEEEMKEGTKCNFEAVLAKKRAQV